jgi:hypothetical protein
MGNKGSVRSRQQNRKNAHSDYRFADKSPVHRDLLSKKLTVEPSMLGGFYCSVS